MPDEDQRFLPIIGYGENLIEPVKPANGYGETSFPRTYSEARQRAKEQILNLRKKLITSLQKNG